MKLKQILRQLGLLLAFVGLGIMMNTNLAQAANPSGVDADATLLTGNTFNTSRDAASTVPGDDGADDAGVQNYPNQLNGVYANGVVDGRITNKTTKFFVKYTTSEVGNLTINKNYNFTKVYPDINSSNNDKVIPLVTNSVASWVSSTQHSVTRIPSTWTELDVNLKDLGNTVPLPIYIGFSYNYTPVLDSGTHRYYTVKLSADDATANAFKDVTIDGNGTVASSATQVTGTAEPGLTVALAGADGSHTATVGEDGKYTIDLGSQSLKDLNAKSTIKVTEYNQFGDAKSATANVVDTVPLTISPATASLTINPDDWAAHVAGKSSTEIAEWLANQTNLQVTKQGGTTPLTAADDGLAFSTDTDLTMLTAGGTQTVNLNATDSNGDKSTTPAAISVTRGLGKLQFGDLTDLAFGAGATLAVPAQSTLFAPGAYQINISDSRATGSPWYLSAEASSMTDSSGHTLSGDVVYEDGSGNETKLDAGNAVPVASGTRSGDSTDVAKDWVHDGNAYTSSEPAGIYLDAKPNIYTGSTANAYSGTIMWYLNDVPGSNN